MIRYPAERQLCPRCGIRLGGTPVLENGRPIVAAECEMCLSAFSRVRQRLFPPPTDYRTGTDEEPPFEPRGCGWREP